MFRIFLAATAATLVAAAAAAAPVTVYFQLTVATIDVDEFDSPDYTGPMPFSSIGIGSVLNGSYSYDSDELPDFAGANFADWLITGFDLPGVDAPGVGDWSRTGVDAASLLSGTDAWNLEARTGRGDAELRFRLTSEGVFGYSAFSWATQTIPAPPSSSAGFRIIYNFEDDDFDGSATIFGSAALSATPFTVTPIPLPAAAPMLVAGLGLLAAIRRRAARA